MKQGFLTNAIVEYEKGNFDQYSYAKAISYLRSIRDMLVSSGVVTNSFPRDWSKPLKTAGYF